MPQSAGGTAPAGFSDPCRLAWANLEVQLHAAGGTLGHLVQVTTFLAERRPAAVRRAALGDRAPALTVVIAGNFDEAWLVATEAVAMA